ncbi:unnamed protein product [Cuscuta europaea]|uniref:Uncharacterized protein n=1 Tax=Cuscuta europaea TaxID=41803 RepID=A0A9P0YX71_CUSEU|nr:unnamed protein product [Cuscuta europaea]
MVIIGGVNYVRARVVRSVIDNPDDVSIKLYNLIGYEGEEIAFVWSNRYVRIIGYSESNLTWFGERIPRPCGFFGMGIEEIKLDDKRGILYVKLSKQATHKIDFTRPVVFVQELLDKLSPSSSGGRKDSSQSNYRKGGGGGSTAQKRINPLRYGGVNAAELEWQEDDEFSWRVVEKLKMGLKIVLVVIVSLGLFRLIEIQKSINQ